MRRAEVAKPIADMVEMLVNSGLEPHHGCLPDEVTVWVEVEHAMPCKITATPSEKRMACSNAVQGPTEMVASYEQKLKRMQQEAEWLVEEARYLGRLEGSGNRDGVTNHTDRWSRRDVANDRHAGAERRFNKGWGDRG